MIDIDEDKYGCTIYFYLTVGGQNLYHTMRLDNDADAYKNLPYFYQKLRQLNYLVQDNIVSKGLDKEKV